MWAATLSLFLASANPALPPLAATKFCLRYPKDCEVSAGSLKRGDPAAVNTRVNRSIRPERQANHTAATERWVISPKAGDCNDYAVTKRHLLLQGGWASADLLLAVVVRQGDGHLVLVVRDMVLDNLMAQPVRFDHAPYDYWVKIQSPANPTKWLAPAKELRFGHLRQLPALHPTAVQRGN